MRDITRRTKIVCTIGPASLRDDVLDAMIAAGMDVARLNTSHGTVNEQVDAIRRVRAAARRAGRPVALLVDLGGPKLRTVSAPGAGPVQLATGNIVHLAPRREGVPEPVLVVDYPNLVSDVGVGERVLIDDGEIALRIERIGDDHVACRVEQGGLVEPRKGVNFPDSNLTFSAITERDRTFIELGVELRVDYFALSFVGGASDIDEARALIERAGGAVPIIAKIERKRAVEHLDEIVAAADGAMVARGDLGVELAPEDVPVWQRRIVASATNHRIPVITATQMLDSMIHSRRPTRAEASDVANAVWEEADAVMLSAETAVGAYPVEAVQMMARIIRRAEQVATPTPVIEPQGLDDHSYLIALATRHITDLDRNMDAVVCFTSSGYTAWLISKAHVAVPILALTPDPHVACRLALARSVVPLLSDSPADVESMLRLVDDTLTGEGLLNPKDEVLVVAGMPMRVQGTTNFVKIHRVGEVSAR